MKPNACVVLYTALYVATTPTFRLASGARKADASPLLSVTADAEKRVQNWLGSILSNKVGDELIALGLIKKIENEGNVL